MPAHTHRYGVSIAATRKCIVVNTVAILIQYCQINMQLQFAQFCSFCTRHPIRSFRIRAITKIIARFLWE